MKLFNLTRWPSVVIFALAGGVAVLFAFISVNLFSQAMASLRFLQQHGWDAVRFGALWQVVELLVFGGLTLVCWLVFKICEQVLEDRYLDWARRDRDR